MTRLKRGSESEPITRLGICAKCHSFSLLYKIEGLYRYRCSNCYKIETGLRHWLDREEVVMRIKVGQRFKLHHIVPIMLEGMEVEVVTVEEDEHGVNVDVKLMQDPEPNKGKKLAYHLGDVVTVNPYQLKDL